MRRATDDGSALIEALVGIGLIAVLLGAATTSHRAAVAAVDQARARTAAVRLAEDVLERPSVPTGWSEPYGGPDGGGVAVGGVAAEEVPPCAPTPVGGGPGRRVVVSRAEGPGVAEDVMLARAPRRDEHDVDGPSLRIHVAELSSDGPTAVEVQGPGGVLTGFLDASGCWQADGLAAGDHHIVLRADDGALIDRTHVLLDERPVRVGIVEGVADVVVAAAAPTQLTVDAITSGARLPDVVAPGSLGWLVERDDLRAMTPLGQPRPIHPGAVAIVVSACADPDAPASRRLVSVGGAAMAVSVPLSVVSVAGLAGHGGATLELVRREGCADDTGQRPWLRWEGGLTDGMRVALPAGVWEGRLLSPTGSRLTAAVTVEASTSEVRMVLP